MDLTDIVRLLREDFPELRDELDDEMWADLPQLQIAVLARHAQALIDAGDETAVRQVFGWVSARWLDGDDATRNAIGVSFLEHLHVTDGKRQRAWAFGLLPEPLRSAATALGVTPTST